jgi:hypothetical protein
VSTSSAHLAGMGRVRRYKKIKAIDPFSKRAKKKDAREHNLPPDMLNHVAQRQESREKARQAAATLQSKPGASKGRGHLKVKAKRKLPQWAKDELKEEARLDRLAATGEMDPSAPQRGDAGESSSAPKKIAMSVTPKVDDETMKQFKKRVREASLKVLKDENRSGPLSCFSIGAVVFPSDSRCIGARVPLLQSARIFSPKSQRDASFSARGSYR